MSVIEATQTIACLVCARVIANGQGRWLGFAIIHREASAREEEFIGGFDGFRN
jgi:hypothetical protein